MYSADLHIHSKYSRATSGDCVPAMLALWARRKGISLLGTGDFTHPAWRQMLADQLIPSGDGLYRLRPEFAAADPCMPPDTDEPQFILSGEISSIYKQDGRVRKVHSVILLPSLESAERLSKKLEAIGNIHSDGRPILGLSAHDLLEITLDTCADAIFIPAHIWTPHFSLFGAFSGFDSIEECFGDLTPHIHALETGLSSDPEMNRRLSALDGYTLVSNSDAHSPAKLGRELNLLDGTPSYPALRRALHEGAAGGFLSTVEFFPEEGKYHFDGHRACGVCLDPAEAAKHDNLCPVCGKRLTTGVCHRVMQLADRPDGSSALSMPFHRLVPLDEVIAAVTGSSSASLKTRARYESLIHSLGNELTILRSLPIEQIEREAGRAIAEGVRRMRAGEIQLTPGFDGEYGHVQLMTQEEIIALSGQLTFLTAQETSVPKKRASKAAPLPEKIVLPAASSAPSAAAGLNEEQQAAVHSDSRITAVIAGPGSGKTRTLIARIAYLMEKGVSPADIAAVTFTNKAAQELRDRLAQRFGNRRSIQGMTVGTFHSIALTLLRRSRPGLTVLDEAAALSLAGEITGGLALNLSPARFLKEIEKTRAGQPYELPDEAIALWKERLLNLNAASFDDLLAASITDPLAPPFAHLLVDEYQDINPMQRDLTEKWAESAQSLFVIGDADQSIYGFRGADAACFDHLKELHPDTRLISLSKNFRSAPEIIACALPVIGKNGGKRIVESAREPGGCVRLIPVQDEYAEGVTIAKEISRMVGGMDMLEGSAESARRTGFSDIAVLYRTHRQAEAIEKCLAEESIPYMVAGRESYLSAPEVVSAIACLRLILNPADQAALHMLLPDLPLPDAAQTENLPAYLAVQGEKAAALAALLTTLAPKAQKEKPKKLLERYQKMQSIRSEAFSQLVSAASAAADLPSFLADLTLGEEGDLSRSPAKTYTPDAVRLMTLHGSKGLEFPVVFIAGMKRGMLPLETPYGRETDLPEERRLFYVGMTRAKDELVLLAHPTPSPFLSDIPADRMKHEEAVYRRKADAGKQLSFL